MSEELMYDKYNIYKVKIGKKKVIIRFIGTQIEELFRYYKIPYEIIQYSKIRMENK